MTAIYPPVEVGAAATEAGLDWAAVLAFLSGLDWLQLFQLIQQLISILKSKRPVMFAASGEGEAVGHSHDQLAHAKAHFEAITQLSECGAKCCG